MTESAAAATSSAPDAGSDVGSPSSFRAAMAAMDSQMPEPEFGVDDPAQQTGQAKPKSAKPPRPGPKDPRTAVKSASEQFIAQRAARQLKKTLAKEREVHEEAPEPELEQEELEDNSAQFEPEEQPEGDEQPELEEETEQPDGEQPQEGEESQDTGGPTPDQQRQFWEACESPHLPEALQDRLIRCSDGEREYDVPIAEMKNGFMRQDRFTRKMQEVSAREEQATAREQHAAQAMESLRGSFTNWRQNPAAFVADMRNLIGDEALGKAVEMHADYMYKVAHMPQDQRQIFLENEALKAQMHRAKMEQQRNEQQQRAQQQKQPAQDPNYQGVLKFAEATVPAIFERHGIWYSHPELGINNRAIQTFSEHLRYAWDGKNETINQAMEAAARATAYEYGQSAQEYYEKLAQTKKLPERDKAKLLKQSVARSAQRPSFPQARPQLGPRGVPGAARKAGDRNARGSVVTGGSPSDFKKLRMSNGLR